MLIGSSSLAGPSSLTESRDTEAGEELCTTIAGVDCASGFLIWARSELVRERERPSSPGGGERSRGEMGQWGMESPELGPDTGFTGRGAFTVSVDDVGVSSGMLVDERARWREVAEGILDTVPVGPRLGLTSALLLRERKPGLAFVPVALATAAVRWGGGAGEASREDRGELAEDGEPDPFNERAPDSAGCRIAAADAASGAAAGPLWALDALVSRADAGVDDAWGAAMTVDADEDAGVRVGEDVGVDAGSADSSTPVRLW